MLKTTFKIFLLFVLLVFVAGATGIATYTVTRRIIEEQGASANQPDAAEQQLRETVPAGASAVPEKEAAEKFEYYFVRLEGENLNIYVSHGGKEEFLYNREIYKNDLSDQDKLMLEEGVKLTSPSALTAFIENFTS